MGAWIGGVVFVFVCVACARARARACVCVCVCVCVFYSLGGGDQSDKTVSINHNFRKER